MASGWKLLGDELRNELLRGIPERRGLLRKMGGFSMGVEAFKSVVDRWVELRGPVVLYYASFTEAQSPARRAKGAYLLDASATLTAPVKHEKLESPYCFAITALAGPGEGFSAPAGTRVTEVFAAGSEIEYREWVSALAAVLATLRRPPT
jgi:hypothetical protein